MREGSAQGVLAPQSDQDAPHPAARRNLLGRLDCGAGRFLDRLSDLVVVGLALWTLLYDLGLFLHVPVDPLTIGWLVGLAGLAVWTLRGPAEAAEPAGGPPVRMRLAVGGFAGLAVLGCAAVVSAVAPGHWPLRWAVLAAAVIGVAAAVLLARAPAAGAAPPAAVRAASGSLLVVAIAAGLATFSLFLYRLSVDDIYYLNRATWVAQRGTIPSGDTLFGNQVFPPLPGAGVPISSFEALQGATARLLGVTAGSVTYKLTLPLATFFAVWALWRLIRVWAPRRHLLGLAFGCVYLLWTGGSQATFGNFHLVRLWQGKSLLVSLLLPLLYVYLTRWAQRPTPRTALLIIAATITAVGLSSSGTFLAPLCLAAAGIGLLLARRVRDLWVLLLGLVYPAAMVLAAHFMANIHEDNPSFFDAPSTFAYVLLGGFLAFIAVAALLLGPWLARSRESALLLVGVSVVTALVLAPGVLHLLKAATGAGPVLWRVLWIVPVPALVGLLAALPAPAPIRPLGAVPAVAAAVVIALVAVPVWSRSNDTYFRHAPAWNYNVHALKAARAIAAQQPGPGPVLAPPMVMGAVAMVTTDVKAVVPRDTYLWGLPPAGNVRARLTAYRLESVPAKVSPRLLTQALQELQVSMACIAPTNAAGRARLHTAGYDVPVPVKGLDCYRR